MLLTEHSGGTGGAVMMEDDTEDDRGDDGGLSGDIATHHLDPEKPPF